MIQLKKESWYQPFSLALMLDWERKSFPLPTSPRMPCCSGSELTTTEPFTGSVSADMDHGGHSRSENMALGWAALRAEHAVGVHMQVRCPLHLHYPALYTPGPLCKLALPQIAPPPARLYLLLYVLCKERKGIKWSSGGFQCRSLWYLMGRRQGSILNIH